MSQIYASCGTCVTEEETTTCTGLGDMMEIASAIL